MKLASEAHGIAVLHRQTRPTLLRSELGLPSLNHCAGDYFRPADGWGWGYKPNEPFGMYAPNGSFG
ncbi:hypothetical protein M4D81_02715 [Paenibacillus sp. p3-SID867]|uniref:hypothetical protein n=1 Tax=Paenibacillus sp. p3-SID867 TaxID=2916363 RepID=UPI0021A5D741|nr:hypothetical protein [Paenibacillus sp. p3-SID867]MCT1397922.1 hypothetical protein [Paenibacillus sp. p3-SID867]